MRFRDGKGVWPEPVTLRRSCAMSPVRLLRERKEKPGAPVACRMCSIARQMICINRL